MTSLQVAADPDEPMIVDRIGVARLAAMMFVGEDLRPLWRHLLSKVTDDAPGAGVAMDLSVLAQMLGDAETGFAIQRQALAVQRLFRSPCRVASPRLRVLALAAVRGLGGNTPLEFLLETSDIELVTLYLPTAAALPDVLPAHDVAFVAIPEDEETRDLLAQLERAADLWPRPLINAPRRIQDLARDRLWRLLGEIEGIEIPHTIRVARTDLLALARGARGLGELLADGGFPIIARPLGSHAGRGLDRIEDAADIERYLAGQPEDVFFISRFVDYASADGLFRKYRVVVVDGRAYPCHMGVSDLWAVWYLNADMALSVDKRAEESAFMATFDETFARRHSGALAAMADAIGLDYVTIDCAETCDGALLIFEADHTGIVHDMDPPDLYPYKSAHMQAIFRAFAGLIAGRAEGRIERAA